MRASPRPVALACLLAVACASDAPPPQPLDLPALHIPIPDPGVEFRPPPSETWSPGTPGEPGVWRAEGPEGSFTLLGSIHLGDARTADLGQRVEEAWQRSDELVLEIDLGAATPAETLALAARYGTLEPPTTLESIVSPQTWALLRDALERAGQPEEPVQSLAPWLAALALTGGAFLADGLDPAQGVDERLRARARGTDGAEGGGKPVVGLETLESQIRALASLPLAAQERMLRDALDPAHAMSPSSLVEAWRRGDVDAFASLLEPQSPEEEILYERLVYRRNREMAARLDTMARDGKERFVVVGLLHLVGDRGIPALLAGRGYTVSRLH